MTTRHRVAFALLVGCAAGALSFWYAYAVPATGNLRPDFDHLWFAARALLHGRDPYPLIGPGREFAWPFRLNYPPPAIVLLAPLGVVPLAVARFLFVAVGVGALAYAIFSERAYLAPVLLSAAAYHAVVRAQQGRSSQRPCCCRPCGRSMSPSRRSARRCGRVARADCRSSSESRSRSRAR